MRWSAALLLVLLCLSINAPAQTSRGTVNGIVTDASGAIVQAAGVTLTNNDTGVARTSTTNGDGLYRFDAVDPGTYSVRIAAAGFRSIESRDVPVTANQVVRVDGELVPGTIESSVEVVADVSVLMQKDAPVRGGNIDPARIADLPFQSRNPVSLALTLPGVSTNRFGPGQSSFTVNGARSRSNNFLLNGVEVNDISITGQGLQILNPDSVQEVSVQTSNYDSEFGRAGGAVVNVITKTGTNRYHGSASFLYDTTHDDAITSTQSLSPSIVGHPPYGTEQYFAGTLGGPIVRNQTFFFGAYQNQRQASNSTANVVSLSPAGRTQLRALFPEGVNANVDTYLRLTGGADATSQFFNTALGNGRPDIQFGTAVTFFPQTLDGHQLLGRVDHRFGSNALLSGQYVFDYSNYPNGGSTLGLPGFTTSALAKNQNAVVADTHIFSPMTTNEARLSYTRITAELPIDPPDPLGLSLPLINIFAVTNLSGRVTPLGIQSDRPQGRIANNYVLQDTMTHIRGTHNFRFGADLMRQRSRQLAPNVERGSLFYQASTPFSGFANFVDDFGGGGGFANRDFGSARYYPGFFRQAYFIQDRWRMTQNLTVTLGLRYENFGNPANSVQTAAFAGLFNIDPATLLGPYALPSRVADDDNNFAPAVGFAYSPSRLPGFLGRLAGDRQTVLRGGYQIGYDSFFNNIASNAAASTPNVISTSTSSAVSGALPRGLPNLSGSLPAVPKPLSPFDQQTLADPGLVNPYYQHWSLGIQRNLPAGLIVDAAYVGSKGTKLYASEDRNPSVPAALRVTPPGYSGPASGRLDNLQGSRTVRSNSGSSIYHAGQLQVSRRFDRHLSLSGSYTYSKLIDNGSDIFAFAGIVNASQPILPHVLGGERNDRAVSLFDRTHRASFAYSYELPFGSGQSGLIGHLSGGWRIAGITSFESGVPFTVANGVDSNGIGGNNDRPDFNPAGSARLRAVPVVDGTGAITGYVNPDAANAPIDPSTARYIGLPAYNAGLAESRQRTGTLGRNTERTKGINNFDVAISKRTAVGEGAAIELRSEFYNVFNHPNYGTASVSPFAPATSGPSATVIGSPSGTFLNAQTGDGGGRVIRYQLKLIF